jgi:hypothetical protein
LGVATERSGDDRGAVSSSPLALVSVSGTYAVCRLDSTAPVPVWAAGGPFVSVSRTADELSVVCEERAVPAGVRREGGWRAVRVASTLDFSTTGVLASLVVPLAKAGVSVFVISTFDTDFLLLKGQSFGHAVEALRQAGHDMRE